MQVFVFIQCILKRIYFKFKIRSLWCNWPLPIGPLCFIPEVSWLPGREEAVWIPPPETVPYQRPDHRLRPSTHPLVVTVCPDQGGKRLDQKTPDGPKDCPAGSWSCRDTVAHSEEGGHSFKSEPRPPNRDQKRPFNAAPDEVWMRRLDFVLL